MKLKNDRRVLNPFGDLQIDVDSLVDHLFGDRTPQPASNKCSCRTPVSVAENETGYSLTFELAGVKPEEVNVEFLDGTLEISGEKVIADLDEGSKYLRNERNAGLFKRSFEFSNPVDGDKIAASFEHGLLKVTVPKSERALPKKIEINAKS